MPLLVTTHKTPVGNLNLLADDQILLGANLSTIAAFKAGKDLKIVKSIPVISDLINDYFDGDISAINGIKVNQPGAPFSQAAWKAMRKISGGKVLSYAE
ncbi:MAG: cysteine methyltransferase, partial [Actinobacteria bacterium]|nr:cysteine methyltransferase [Actinomycetota bacterium]